MTNIFCDRIRNNNIKKKRKYRHVQKLYNPTNGQNGTSSGNNNWSVATVLWFYFGSVLLISLEC